MVGFFRIAMKNIKQETKRRQGKREEGGRIKHMQQSKHQLCPFGSNDLLALAKAFPGSYSRSQTWNSAVNLFIFCPETEKYVLHASQKTQLL